MKLKELCETVGMQYDSKHSKDIFNKIKQEYLVEKNGRDYNLIRSLTGEEKANVKKLSDCKKILADTIYVQLSLVKENKIRSDIKGFLELFNMVNNNYKYFTYEEMNDTKYEILQESEDPKFENLTLYNFVTDVHPILNRLVKETFNKMVDERLIYKRDILMFGYYRKYKNDDGTIVEIRQQKEADEEQIRQFLGYSRKYMDQYGYKKWSEVPYLKKIEINRKICKDMDISYVYNEYEIILNNEFLQKEVDNRESLKRLKDSLNKKTIDKLVRSQQGYLKEMTYQDKKDKTDRLIKRTGVVEKI